MGNPAPSLEARPTSGLALRPWVARSQAPHANAVRPSASLQLAVFPCVAAPPRLQSWPVHCPLRSPNCPLGLALPFSRQCIASHRIARSRSPRRQPAATLFDGTDCFFDPDLIRGPRDKTDLLHSTHRSLAEELLVGNPLHRPSADTSPFFPIVLHGLATTTSSLIDNPKHPRLFSFLSLIRMSRTSKPRPRSFETTPILERDCWGPDSPPRAASRTASGDPPCPAAS